MTQNDVNCQQIIIKFLIPYPTFMKSAIYSTYMHYNGEITMCSTFTFIFSVRRDPELKEHLLKALLSEDKQTIHIGRFILMFFPDTKKVEIHSEISDPKFMDAEMKYECFKNFILDEWDKDIYYKFIETNEYRRF